MKFEVLSFGLVKIDGNAYAKDVVIDHGKIRKRRKKASRKFRNEFGHTPLSVEEEIPWACRHLVVGTGLYGGLPVMDDVKLEAQRRNVDLIILPTPRAIAALRKEPQETNAILHITC